MDVLAVYPFLQKFALKLTHNVEQANDLAHDTVVKILENADKFDGSNLQAWAGKIMFNTFVTQFRRRKFDTQFDPEPYIMSVPVDPRQEQVTQLGQVMDAVMRLSPDKRESMLRLAYGDRYADIAERMNVPIGTVRSRVSRARRDLN